MSTSYILDGSDYDWQRGSFDVAAMARDGIVGLTHKATEAGATKHVNLATALNRGRSAGLQVLGAYHVVRSSPSVAAQVTFFFSYLDSQVPWWRTWPGFILQADLEKWSYDAVSAATGIAFITELQARKPATCWVVTYASRGQYGDSLDGLPCPLWNAAYPSSRSAPYRDMYPGDGGTGWTAYSGQTPVFWQYASTATVGTQPTCDINAFRGDLPALLALVRGDDMSGEADRAFSTPYAQHLAEIRPDSWMALAVELGINNANQRIIDMHADLTAARADIAGSQQSLAAVVNGVLALIQAGGGNVDTAAIVAKLDAMALAESEAVAALRAELRTAKTNISDLKARLAKAFGITEETPS